ncbi:unnamed protein product [Prorocentrum cordatum]|uniref:Uncharacterized protein n=1 Tax=Prorocentrum cordatum TaxID=2364126 RepID=A0ABN9WPX6_9DINO|nr:unnamed protein product [Polarella glacialis]
MARSCRFKGTLKKMSGGEAEVEESESDNHGETNGSVLSSSSSLIAGESEQEPDYISTSAMAGHTVEANGVLGSETEEYLDQRLSEVNQKARTYVGDQLMQFMSYFFGDLRQAVVQSMGETVSHVVSQTL